MSGLSGNKLTAWLADIGFAVRNQLSDLGRAARLLGQLCGLGW
jgi:hypothetical protein